MNNARYFRNARRRPAPRINVTLNLETGEARVWDTVLGGERVIRSSLELIRDQLRLLCAYRDDGRRPSPELLDDIRAYEAILESEDPAARAEAYMKFRHGAGRERAMALKPRMVARELGWMG